MLSCIDCNLTLLNSHLFVFMTVIYTFICFNTLNLFRVHGVTITLFYVYYLVLVASWMLL